MWVPVWVHVCVHYNIVVFKCAECEGECVGACVCMCMFGLQHRVLLQWRSGVLGVRSYVCVHVCARYTLAVFFNSDKV